jgi:hypothetical protein
MAHPGLPPVLTSVAQLCEKKAGNGGRAHQATER